MMICYVTCILKKDWTWWWQACTNIPLNLKQPCLKKVWCIPATTGQVATSRIRQYSKSPAGRMDAKGNGGVWALQAPWEVWQYQFMTRCLSCCPGLDAGEQMASAKAAPLIPRWLGRVCDAVCFGEVGQKQPALPAWETVNAWGPTASAENVAIHVTKRLMQVHPSYV